MHATTSTTWFPRSRRTSARRRTATRNSASQQSNSEEWKNAQDVRSIKTLCLSFGVLESLEIIKRTWSSYSPRLLWRHQTTVKKEIHFSTWTLCAPDLGREQVPHLWNEMVKAIGLSTTVVRFVQLFRKRSHPLSDAFFNADDDELIKINMF